MDIKKSLINLDDCLVIVIDIQDSFLSKYDAKVAQEMVGKAAWLLEVANHLRVPVVAMAEDIKEMGGLSAPIANALPKNMIVHDKDAFGLASNPEILAAVQATKRKTAILIGMETDVCVAQSALGLLENGFSVVAVKDALITTEGDAEIGLMRMRDAGAVISTVKALYYEWMRSVTNTVGINKERPDLRTTKRPGYLKM